MENPSYLHEYTVIKDSTIFVAHPPDFSGFERTGRTTLYLTEPLQGAQFTADAFTSLLKNAEIRISMDGRGRYLDNIFIECLWRSVKYENIYIWRYETVPELATGLDNYFDFYNNHRFHQALGNSKPVQLYRPNSDS